MYFFYRQGNPSSREKIIVLTEFILLPQNFILTNIIFSILAPNENLTLTLQILCELLIGYFLIPAPLTGGKSLWLTKFCPNAKFVLTYTCICIYLTIILQSLVIIYHWYYISIIWFVFKLNISFVIGVFLNCFFRANSYRDICFW